MIIVDTNVVNTFYNRDDIRAVQAESVPRLLTQPRGGDHKCLKIEQAQALGFDSRQFFKQCNVQ